MLGGWSRNQCTCASNRWRSRSGNANCVSIAWVTASSSDSEISSPLAATASEDWIISIAGVLIFLGLTAYDTQFLKEMGESVPHDDATAVRRGAIIGALKLYLDFINIFIMLLRIFGGNRE